MSVLAYVPFSYSLAISTLYFDVSASSAVILSSNASLVSFYSFCIALLLSAPLNSTSSILLYIASFVSF